MSQSSSSNASVLRILLVAVPLSLACSALTYYWSQSLEDTARTKLEQNVLENMLSGIRSIKKQSTFSTVDANHDMVADTPEDSGDLQQPEKLIFSYIAEEGGDQETEDGLWDALVSAIAASTGKPLEVKQYQQVAAQLEALREGEVHILGLGTGAAPLAVQTAGFVPLCTMANADGDVGYTMMLLTAANSGIQDLAGVKGHRVVFVRPTSNSGFKAAFVQLYDDAGLLPERDYEWSFSLSHQSSVHDVLSGEADVAPVASDILAKMVEQGEVEESQYRVLYKSEAFPPAVIGCAYNLPAEMIEQIRSTLIGFDWSGTGLEEQFGPMGAAKFVGVNYKDDWANIRRIDDAVESLADRP